jgi:uncharacterized peroxidase-related enzyme
MAYIETREPQATEGQARAMLERQQRAWGFVPNYAKVFTERADVMDEWAALLGAIRRHIDPRRFELVTFAAAVELRSSYCALAHGRVLREKLLDEDEMRALVSGDRSVFSDAENAMMDLARKVSVDASSVTAEDVDRLRRTGFEENEIFDVVATAAARSFLAKLTDALGVQPDASFFELAPWLRERLTVGRPIDTSDPIRLPEPAGSDRPEPRR